MPSTDQTYSTRNPGRNWKTQSRWLVSACLILWAAGMLACDRASDADQIRALHRQGRFEESLEPLRELLEAHPDDAEIHLLYGAALVQTGDSRVAVWSLRKAAEDPRWAVRANLELAAVGMRASNWADAIDATTRVLELEPDHVTAHFIRGEAYLSEGKEPDLALEEFEIVLDQDPENVAALTSRAAALLLAGRVDEVEETIDELEALAEEADADDAARARLCALRAVLTSERGQLEEAEELIEACVEEFPSYAVVIEPAMSFFDQRGRPERATEILEKALELSPNSQSYRSELASRAKGRGDFDAVEEILKGGTVLEDSYVRSAAWTALTNHYLERDELPAAVRAYEEALALAEDPPPLAILSHADLLARAGEHERALEVAKTLDNDAYQGLIESRVLLNEGHPAEALARLDEVLPTWPNNAGARYYAARAAEQTGDFSRAIEEYRQSIRSAPEQTEAALRLAKLYLAAGAMQNAWGSSGQYFRAHPDDPEGVRVILQSAAPSDAESLKSLFQRLRPTPLWAVAVATRAETVAERRGVEAALELLAETDGVDLRLPRNAELLRSNVVHRVAAGQTAEARPLLDPVLEAQPENAAIHEIHGIVLEAEKAPVESIREAYGRAVELDPKASRALESLGRLAEAEGDMDAALALYDRATEAYLASPSAAHRAAQLAERSGRAEETERRYLELLREHPWDAAAARELARLQLDRGAADDGTLELAERAVLFRGGEDAKKLLIRVHEALGQSERAAEIAKAMEAGQPIPPRRIAPLDLQ